MTYHGPLFRTRGAKLANTAAIDGVGLDEIPWGSHGERMGMVLVHRNWKRIYFVRERTDWTEDEYFQYAMDRIEDMGIIDP